MSCVVLFRDYLSIPYNLFRILKSPLLQKHDHLISDKLCGLYLLILAQETFVYHQVSFLEVKLFLGILRPHVPEWVKKTALTIQETIHVVIALKFFIISLELRLV